MKRSTTTAEVITTLSALLPDDYALGATRVLGPVVLYRGGTSGLSVGILMVNTKPSGVTQMDPLTDNPRDLDVIDAINAEVTRLETPDTTPWITWAAELADCLRVFGRDGWTYWKTQRVMAQNPWAVLPYLNVLRDVADTPEEVEVAEAFRRLVKQGRHSDIRRALQAGNLAGKEGVPC